ncbi:MAG TPA: hypothetical protein VJP85_05575 [Candidatus Baltobacteraceae bacterium]|nr:hypothetical protein [Candidatus Baltobacteraceae bacterium]
MKKFVASVQYGEWVGSVEADNIDHPLPSIERYLRDKRALRDDESLIGISMFNGENGRFDEPVTSASVTAYVIPVANYEQAKDFLNTHHPAPVRAIHFEIGIREFFQYFKRFNVYIAASDLPLNGRAINVTEERSL